MNKLLVLSSKKARFTKYGKLVYFDKQFIEGSEISHYMLSDYKDVHGVYTLYLPVLEACFYQQCIIISEGGNVISILFDFIFVVWQNIYWRQIAVSIQEYIEGQTINYVYLIFSVWF